MFDWYPSIECPLPTPLHDGSKVLCDLILSLGPDDATKSPRELHLHIGYREREAI